MQVWEEDSCPKTWTQNLQIMSDALRATQTYPLYTKCRCLLYIVTPDPHNNLVNVYDHLHFPMGSERSINWLRITRREATGLEPKTDFLIAKRRGQYPRWMQPCRSAEMILGMTLTSLKTLASQTEHTWGKPASDLRQQPSLPDYRWAQLARGPHVKSFRWDSYSFCLDRSFWLKRILVWFDFIFNASLQVASLVYTKRRQALGLESSLVITATWN